MFNDLFENKRVLITGHTGFKGSWLSEWLIKLGADVTGYALPPTYEDSHFELLGLKDRLKHVEGDLRDFDHFANALNAAQPDIVLHLAAQALVRPAYADPVGTFSTNVMGGAHVLEAVRGCDSVRVLTYITSDKAYHNVNWEWGYREPDELGGHDPYSASKGCAELVFRAYWCSFLKESGRLSAATTRAGNVIGGGDWAVDRLIPDCIRALRKAETIEIRSPEATRPWQHVLEPLGGYLLLTQRLWETEPGEMKDAWNFGPGHSANRCVEEVVRDVIKTWGSGDFAIHRNPNAPREDHWLQLNTDRANHYLDWEPVWKYHDSIHNTVKWYAAYRDGEDMQAYTNKQIDLYMQDWVKKGRP